MVSGFGLGFPDYCQRLLLRHCLQTVNIGGVIYKIVLTYPGVAEYWPPFLGHDVDKPKPNEVSCQLGRWTLCLVQCQCLV